MPVNDETAKVTAQREKVEQYSSSYFNSANIGITVAWMKQMLDANSIG